MHQKFRIARNLGLSLEMVWKRQLQVNEKASSEHFVALHL